MSHLPHRRVAVVGFGPVGMIIGVHLQESGVELAICESNLIRRDKIREEGVRLTGLSDRQVNFPNLFRSASELVDFKPDWIIAAVKCPDLPGLMEEIKKLAPLAPRVVCAMNGIDSEGAAIAALGHGRVMRMVLNFAGNLVEPNVTKVNFITPPNYIASVDGSHTGEAEEIAQLLSDSGLITQCVGPDEIVKRVWEKTILNASLSAMCGIGRLTIQEAMENPDTLEIVEQTIEEAVEVAEAEKIRFGDDFIRQCLRYLRKGGSHFPSLAVDLINHKQTEIDFINGKIVDYGRKHYVRTSLNLAFTNTVKAMQVKNSTLSIREANANFAKGFVQGISPESTSKKNIPCYLGVDLGSTYSKFTVIDGAGNVMAQTATKTHNRDKVSVNYLVNILKNEFDIQAVCATGYGRKHFHEADLVKTELNCASDGTSHLFPGAKNIIDIGGEDIKIIQVNKDNFISNFTLNDKCAAGTGAFLVEVIEKAGIPLGDTSDLASKSDYNKELNSFCTVFAKTEIMGWLFEGLKVEDIARGIYLSIVHRVAKMRIDPSLPIYMIGGVVAWHPFLAELLSQKIKTKAEIIPNPQFTVSLGAALAARNFAANRPESSKKELEITEK